MKMNWATYLALMSTAIILGSCRPWPPLEISHEGEVIIVGVETLGEYSTSVGRIRISEADTDEVVLDLRSDSAPEIWRFALHLGKNSTRLERLPDWADYRVIVPRSETEFFLEKGVDYSVEVWGKSKRARSVAEIRF